MSLAPHDKVKVALPIIGGLATFTGFVMNSTGRSQTGNILFAVGALLTAISGATMIYSVLSKQQTQRPATDTSLRVINPYWD